MIDRNLNWINKYYEHIKQQVLINEERNKKKSELLLGNNFFFYDYQTLKRLFEEVFVEQEYFFKSSKANPIIIDCGANIGMTSLYFHYLMPEAQLIAFEANPFVYQLLQENTKHLPSIQVYNAALNDVETSLPFYIGENIGSMVASFTNVGQNRAIMVKTQKLSTYLQAIEDEVDLIKIDVEGAEHPIIKDLVETGMLHKVKEYIIEYHHYRDQEPRLGSFLQQFESVGFSYEIIQFKSISQFQCIVLKFYKTNG